MNFTRSSVQKIDTAATPTVMLMPRKSQDPSIRVISMPKIDQIDYVTFILGSIGAWLGLSVLNLNPVSFILLCIPIKMLKKTNKQTKRQQTLSM